MTTRADETSVDEAELALAELRGSLESRCRQAGFAAAAMAVYTVLTALLLAVGEVVPRLVGWMILCTSLLLARLFYSRWVRRHLAADAPELRRLDSGFRAISALSQLAAGAGIWVVGNSDTVTTAYVVTLFIALYGVGAIINLAHDYPSVKMTLPLLLIQPFAYWIVRGGDGVFIALLLPGLGYMMLTLAQNSYRNFNDSIRIRFEKDRLLQRLAAEQRATADALAAAESANRSKSFFMAAASHDLRQPLYAVSILHDALALQQLPPEPARLLAQQGVAIKATSSLFDNLLDLSKFESGVVVPQFAGVSLADLLRELETEFAPQCATRGLWLRVAPELPAVHSDRELLGRLLRNLISNALRYTEHGGIEVCVASTAEGIVLSISDTGIGIAPADQERVFGEFVQVGNPQRARERGTGLGLAIVRHIARLLQHTIRLHSTPGAGTTVEVIMAPPEPGEAGAAPAAAASTPAGIAPALRGRSAWIVDDDPLVRNAVSEYLVERGCLCTSAATYRELQLRTAPGSQPDFVILDDMLGESVRGLDIALDLSSRLPRGRILLTTGNSDPGRWRELLASGLRVERKPVSAVTLNAWLAEALS